ncbi:response regulator [Nitrospina gracilis]|uniref:response regulator n=1 Tax=Nitrospina gracilis TaxID=35801 RepID=UPI001F3C428B|nr:response regulator transcription factor [Nitrospina gracilis]MCF8721564.1 two-component system phosphate regulon response regulator PhoB [Nitrospina gracilis Nb-211]
MTAEKILVVEDEEDIQELIRYNLAREAFQVTCVDTGEKALKQVEKEAPDLVVLDLMLPGIDGLNVCRSMKADADLRAIPIIMVTAKGEESDVVTGLEMGADDYVTKPFSPKIFISRVRAVLRRRGETPKPADPNGVLKVKDLTIHPGRHEAKVKGKKLDLTFTEFRILEILASRPGWVFTRGQLVDAIRGEDHAVTDRSVDFQIVGLRKKLGDCADYIETVRGVGYRFQDDA